MNQKDKSLKESLAESLVASWHYNATMSYMIRHTYLKAGITPPEKVEEYFNTIAKLLNVKRIFGDDRVQTWIPRHMRELNEALWNGRNTEHCVRIARKILGLRVTGGNFGIKARELDKKHDWHTVK